MQGRSVVDFVIAAAQRAAEEAIERREVLKLALEDQERFAAALINPPPLAPALRRAAERYRKLVRKP